MPRRAAISGATIRQGPHHGAQKSTTTGTFDARDQRVERRGIGNFNRFPQEVRAPPCLPQRPSRRSRGRIATRFRCPHFATRHHDANGVERCTRHVSGPRSWARCGQPPRVAANRRGPCQLPPPHPYLAAILSRRRRARRHDRPRARQQAAPRQVADPGQDADEDGELKASADARRAAAPSTRATGPAARRTPPRPSRRNSGARALRPWSTA